MLVMSIVQLTVEVFDGLIAKYNQAWYWSPNANSPVPAFLAIAD